MDLVRRSELPSWLLQKFGNASNLAAALGTTRQTAYNLLGGQTSPNDETCRRLGLSPVFLLESSEKKQMSTLEQFLAQRERDREAQTRAVATAQRLQERGAALWKELQNETRSTAARIGSVDGVPLDWDPFPFLKLQYVAATFTPGLFAGGPPKGCRIIFGRIPTGVYLDDKSLVAPEVWELTLSIQGEEFLWSVNQNEILGVTSPQLAEQIIVRLIQYRDRYQAAYRIR